MVSRFVRLSRWFGVLAAALVSAALSATSASAQAGTPSFSVSFSPSSISLGGTATLTYTIAGDPLLSPHQVM
jgi:hypothetical protein